jgi:flagellar M-ring protein FliF
MATGAQLEKTPPEAAAVGSLQQRAKGLWGKARVGWARMLPRQRRWSVVAAGMLLVLLGGLAWSGLHTEWRTLYSELDADDARQVAQVLTQAQIKFRTTAAGNGVEVPSNQLDKARLATAAKGGVRSGRMGFELFDKPNWVGSEFDEQVNYQRALEGELEKTIGTLSDIESARVHLVMPHDSLFRDQERPAKASVVLKLRHRSLADGEPEAIRNLVSSAVDGLTSDRVALVDAAGHLPLGPKTAETLRLSAEESLEQKLIATLEPVTGPGNVRASVTLDYEAAATEETDENYDPDKTVTLSMQRAEQNSGPQKVAAGVPGTASNAPNSQSVPVYPQVTTPAGNSKQESSTYGASKTTRHVVENPGRIRRMTAAIVVNDRMLSPAMRGRAAQWQPRTADELKELTALAEASVGFDSTRGDLLTVQDLSFEGNRSQPLTLWDQILAQAQQSPVVVKYAALVLGLLIVVAFGVRPAVKRTKSAPPPKEKRPKELKGEKKPEGKQLPPQPEPSIPAEVVPEPERTRSQEIFDQVSEQLKRNPAQSSRLLQSWIHSDS